ncbi:MAG: flavodoxin family protein [Bacillota bacterium]|nr:flavodoxin family protein [Bacillota bacterium]
MHVLMINGSPNKAGCTVTAMREVAEQLNRQGIETPFFHIGKKPIRGCIACGKCAKTGLCIFDDDPVNSCIEQLIAADGVIVGSPVYYAGPNAALCALLDRVFYLKSKKYAYKPAAAIVNCRRGGASAAFDRLNKYFTIANMPLVPSQYWNSTHGSTPEQVRQDLEGLQVMRTLGRNMSWLLKCIEAAQGVVPYPEAESRVFTNFIRKDD